MAVETLKCPNCGAPLTSTVNIKCEYCGNTLETAQQNKGLFSISFGNKKFEIGKSGAANKTGKSRSIAILLAILSLFSVGVAYHHLYLRNIGLFILSFFPPFGYIITVINLLTYLGMSDEEFEREHAHNLYRNDAQ